MKLVLTVSKSLGTKLSLFTSQNYTILLFYELYLSKKFAILVTGTKLRTEATQRQDILLKSSSTNST